MRCKMITAYIKKLDSHLWWLESGEEQGVNFEANQENYGKSNVWHGTDGQKVLQWNPGIETNWNKSDKSKSGAMVWRCFE